MKVTTFPTKWLPPAADGVQLPPSGTAWTYGAWQTITTGLPTPAYLLYTAILPNDGALGGTNWSAQVQLGTGAISGETVIATQRAFFTSNQWGNRSTLPLGLPLGAIGSGIRIAARVAHSLSSDTDAYRVALGYLEGDVAASPTTRAQSVTPIDSATVSVTGSTWPTWSAWAQLLSAAEVTGIGNLYITGMIAIVALGSTGRFEIQLGTGGAGTEAPVCTIPYSFLSTGSGVSYFKFPHPIRVNSGTRISARQRGGSSLNLNVTIWYVSRP